MEHRCGGRPPARRQDLTFGRGEPCALARFDATGALDPAFGTDGWAPAAVGTSWVTCSGLAVQSDGKIVVGSGDRIERYDTTGALDPAFGVAGVSILADFVAFTIAIQPDGKILVGGLDDTITQDRAFQLVRFDGTGALDPTFGTGGSVTMQIGSGWDSILDIHVEADGRILVGGRSLSAPVLARYLADGTLDPTFGVGGLVIDPSSEGSGVASFERTATHILATWGHVDGTSYVARFLPDGTLDTSFGSGGNAGVSGSVRAIAVQAAGHIVGVGATLDADTQVARLEATGGLDASFGDGGMVVHQLGGLKLEAHGSVAQVDGKILLVGDSEGGHPFTDEVLTVVRYGPDGDVDSTFGTGGAVLLPIEGDETKGEAVVVQADGKVVVVGWLDSSRGDDAALVARLHPDGTLDASFGDGGFVLEEDPEPAPVVRDAVVQADGKIVGLVVPLSATRRHFLLRWNADGSRDLTFGTGGSVTVVETSIAYDSALALQPDGRIVVSHHDGLSRFLPDGTRDATFGVHGTVLSAGVSWRRLAIAGDGSIVAGGTSGIVERYSADGVLDAGFGTAGRVTLPASPADQVQSLAVQGDGKIVIGFRIHSPSAMEVVRLDASGALDSGFGVGGIAREDDLWSVAGAIVQDGGRIVIPLRWTAADTSIIAYEGGSYCGNGTVEAGEQCDDGGSLDGDCCSATCQIDADGVPCDDGDACTVGDSCTAGACGTFAPTSCGNGYFCYRTRGSGGAPRFGGASAVSLADGLEAGLFDSKKQQALCAPASLNGQPAVDLAVHQLAYSVKSAPGEPKHVRISGLEVTDRFGTHLVDTVKPDRLLLPASKGLGGPVPTPAPGQADAYKCYKVRLTKSGPKFPKKVRVTGVDAFEDRSYDVKRPLRLCLAVDKDGVGIANDRMHLTCYLAKRAPGFDPHTKVLGQIHASDDFGTWPLDTLKRDDLCVPATVSGLP